MKVRHVEIKVRQYADGTWGFDDYSLGRRKRVRLITKERADIRAGDIAVLTANSRADLLGISRYEFAQFRAWQKANADSKPVGRVIQSYLRLKRNKSGRHLDAITRDLNLFCQFIGDGVQIGSIKAGNIQDFLDSRDVGGRRKFNLRAIIISLFRFARRLSYLPDMMTEAEKVEPIERMPGEVQILSPTELRTLIDNVREEFLPWLLIAAFAGIRSEEIAPDPKSKKSPLRWEDADWRHRTITVRSETSKTKEERDVPLLPNLAVWLAPYRNRTGPVCSRQPSKRETKRLGEFIGGWKHNALRDSFCSYRARITRNIPQVSYEMGNSIAMVKRSYHRRQAIRPARDWFNIRPDPAKNIIHFQKTAKNCQNKHPKSAQNRSS